MDSLDITEAALSIPYPVSGRAAINPIASAQILVLPVKDVSSSTLPDLVMAAVAESPIVRVDVSAVTKNIDKATTNAALPSKSPRRLQSLSNRSMNAPANPANNAVRDSVAASVARINTSIIPQASLLFRQMRCFGKDIPTAYHGQAN